jgi:trehalose-6-phosphatase
VVVKPGKSVTASCKGAAIPYTLDEPAQDSIAVQLTLGNDATQCMQFGGLVQKDQPAAGKKVGVFQAKNAPAPASCPLP